MQLNQEEDCVRISQEIYTGGLDELDVTDKKDKGRKLSVPEKESFQKTVGQLCRLANQTRPGVAFEACEMSIAYKDAMVGDALMINKAIRKVKSDNLAFKFSNLDLSTVSVVVHSDASYKNLPNGASQGGFIIFLCDNDDNISPIHWQSRKSKCIVKSTLAAECLSLQEAAETALLIKTIFTEMMPSQGEPINIQCFTDNRSLKDSIYSTKTLQDKHLIIDMAIIKEMITTKEIESVSWIESELQLVDCLTKRGASATKLLDVLCNGKMKM